MIPAELLAEIESFARTALGNSFHIRRVTPVDGGDINTCLRIEANDGRPLFAKSRPVDDNAMFEAEAEGLRALTACSQIRIPEVIAQGKTDTHTLLLLEWLDLHPLQPDNDGVRAGEALADMHRIRAERYGFAHDNFIGSTPQQNTWHDNWARFYGMHRLAPQLALATERGFRGPLQRDGERVIERLAALFLEYRPGPSLLHGDLWHGNIGVTRIGEPALFDPACYYGDREADVAMSELFGGFPTSFYVAYRRVWPMDAGYERRKVLYNLYHVLNHLNIFGRSYLGQAERMAARLAAGLGR